MTRFKIDDITIRVWREERTPTHCPYKMLSGMSSVLEGIRDKILIELGDIANAVGAVDKDITAVEVLDNEGDGVVLYFQWP